MKKIEHILSSLKSSGHRLTTARKAIIKLFIRNRTPMSPVELTLKLNRMNVHVNKTTVYREIDFLKNQGVIRELMLGDGKRRYEASNNNHHHHLICERCESIECVELDGCLQEHEARIMKENNFITKRHILEFHGLCEKCR